MLNFSIQNRFILSFLFLGSIVSKTATADGNGWTVNPGSFPYFIENKGQLKDIVPGGQIVYYCSDNTGTKTFFTPQGIVIKVDRPLKWKSLSHDSKEKTEKDLEEEYELNKDYGRGYASSFFSETFIGTENNPVITAEEKSSAFLNYVNKEAWIGRIPAYSTLRYKNIYPGIDVVYTIPSEGGIKSAYIIHPGADPSMIRIRLSAKLSYKDQENNLHFKFAGEEVIEHAPYSFYEGTDQTVDIKWQYSDSILSFQVPAFDRKKTLIIDPWTVVTGSYADNKILDVQMDGRGNVYGLGSQNPYKIWKYDSLGTLLWITYTDNSEAEGDFAVDPSGNVFYSTAGTYYKKNTILKLDSAGNLEFKVPKAGSELWRMAFDPGFSTLYLANQDHLEIVDAFGNVTKRTYLGMDIRALCTAPNGNIYSLVHFSPAYYEVNIMGHNTSLVKLFQVRSSYKLNYRPGPLYTNSYDKWKASGANYIAAGKKFLYVANGSSIFQHDPVNGNKLNSLKIPSGVFEMNAGIAVDSCGRVFFGSQNGVYIYDDVLKNQLDFQGTPGPVYDIYMSGDQRITCSGDGFIAMFSNSWNTTFLKAGHDDVVCLPTQSYQLSAAQSNITGLNWKTLGSGSFDNPAALNPTYFFSNNDILAGQVTLVLSPVAQLSCYPASDTLTLIIKACAPVSLDLINFSVRKIDSKVKAEWNLAQNNAAIDHFGIERLNDVASPGREMLSAIPYTENVLHYESIDANPKPGKNYYRLKTVFKNGKTDYSAAKTIEFSSVECVPALSPNPVKEGNAVLINFPDTDCLPYKVIITDGVGNLIYSVNSHERDQIIPVSFGKGFYFISIIGDRGYFTCKKIVVY